MSRSTPPRWVVGLYRLAVLALPPAFRRQYALEMENAFRRLLEDEAASGLRAVLRIGFHEATDAFQTGVRLRQEALARRRGAPEQRTGRRSRAALSTKVETMWNDLRFAVRVWRRHPTSAATIVVSVALGIAAVSTIFSWAQGLILRPLPEVHEPGRLVSLKPRGPGGLTNVAWEEFRDWRDQAASFEGAAAFGIRRIGLQAPGDAAGVGTEPVWGMLVSGEYFGVLGAGPQLGRMIGTEDTRAIGSGHVAVISDALWKRRYGEAPDIIGRSILLNGRDITVVGVAAPRFAGTYVGLSFDVWAPLTIQEELGGPAAAMVDREFRWLQAFARLLPAVHPEQAANEATVIGRRLAERYPASRDVSLITTDLDVGAAGRLVPLFTVLLSLAVVVLVVVCATVSNLLLAQATKRESEMAVRLATGARPLRLVRQLLTESTLLAVLAGGLGLLISIRARDLFTSLLPPSPLPLAIDTPLDARVLGVSVAVTALSLLTFGLAPAFGAVRRATSAGLRASLGPDPARVRWRRGLVAAQIAFSLTALASSAIFARRLIELRNVDRGFDDSQHVLLVTTDLDVAGITDPVERRSVVMALMDSMRGIPGVTGATMASFVPLGFTGYREVELDVPGFVPRADQPAAALLSEIGHDYFDVMRGALSSGRSITRSDRSDGRPVAVVNEALIARFGLDNPLGRRIRLDGREVEVVGVARDGKYRFDELDLPARPFAYVPWQQWGDTELTVHLRTEGDPLTLVPALETLFEEVDPRLPVLTPTTLDAYTSLPLFPARLATTVVGFLAVGALALSGLGLYGVTCFAVASRTRELGVRMALGAGRGRLVRLLFVDSARFAAIGLAVGLLLSFVTTRILLAIVTQLRPDPWATVAATGVLLLIFTAAVALAARRVLRIDPARALRDA